VDINATEGGVVSHNPDIAKKIILKNGDIPHITQYAHTVLPAGKTFSKHAHKDMSEVFTFVSGEGEMEIDGNVFAVKTGTTACVRPNEYHEIRNTSGGDLSVLYFGIQE